MIPFFEKTWFLWWIFAVVVILRWFHTQSADGAFEEAAETDEMEKSVHASLGDHLSLSA